MVVVVVVRSSNNKQDYGLDFSKGDKGKCRGAATEVNKCGSEQVRGTGVDNWLAVCVECG